KLLKAFNPGVFGGNGGGGGFVVFVLNVTRFLFLLFVSFSSSELDSYIVLTLSLISEKYSVSGYFGGFGYSFLSASLKSFDSLCLYASFESFSDKNCPVSFHQVIFLLSKSLPSKVQSWSTVDFF